MDLGLMAALLWSPRQHSHGLHELYRHPVSRRQRNYDSSLCPAICVYDLLWLSSDTQCLSVQSTSVL